MHWMTEGKGFYELLSKETLSSIVELRVHPYISEYCSKVHDFLLAHQHIKDLTLAESEVLHLQFNRLEEEITSIFQKESGLLFPCFRENLNKPDECIAEAIVGLIQNSQHRITVLLVQIRQVLNNYIPKNWSDDFRECANNLFELEAALYRWIHIEQNFLFKDIQPVNNLYAAH